MNLKPSIKGFISWSKKDSISYHMADTVKTWLPKVFEPFATIELFHSEKDINCGKGWFEVISNYIRESSFCISCITQESIDSEWLKFETFAHFPNYYLLSDRKLNNLQEPFKYLQIVKFGRTGFQGLIEFILEQIKKKYQECDIKNEVEANFEKYWVDIERGYLGTPSIYNFWTHFLRDIAPNQTIYVVVSFKGHGEEYKDRRPTGRPGRSVKISFSEVNSFFSLEKLLTKIKEDTQMELIHSQYNEIILNDDDDNNKNSNKKTILHSNNMIIIGSSHSNAVFEEVRKELRKVKSKSKFPYRFRFYKDKKYIQRDNGILTTTDKSDYFIVVRTANPFTPGRKIIMIAGSYGYSTNSGIKLIVDKNCEDTMEEIIENVGENDFVALLQSQNLDNNEGKDPKLVEIYIKTDDGWIKHKLEDHRDNYEDHRRNKTR